MENKRIKIIEFKDGTNIDWKVDHFGKTLCNSGLSIFADYWPTFQQADDFSLPYFMDLEERKIVFYSLLKSSHETKHKVPWTRIQKRYTGNYVCARGYAICDVKYNRFSEYVEKSGPLWEHIRYSVNFETREKEESREEFCKSIGNNGYSFDKDLPCILHSPLLNLSKGRFNLKSRECFLTKNTFRSLEIFLNNQGRLLGEN
ncbi:hypothetical protein HN832_04185 [archaeon]|jgi:hypothetical protein|nr:hypothetical protein [archaeon]MBT4373407.1 hypothetical protein [archaeon]MBT4531855.1 hypothetical protein [archaeon]MBT7001522.1 hypothetical protein [archaeon]MBT7282586.1 hypothetical protein [archaeon]